MTPAKTPTARRFSGPRGSASVAGVSARVLDRRPAGLQEEPFLRVGDLRLRPETRKNSESNRSTSPRKPPHRETGRSLPAGIDDQFQRSAGISVTASRPSRSPSQNAFRSSAPGYRPAIPTTATGTGADGVGAWAGLGGSAGEGSAGSVRRARAGRSSAGRVPAPGPPVQPSTITWALVPPSAKQLTAATRGASGQGVSSRAKVKGVAARSKWSSGSCPRGRAPTAVHAASVRP